MRDRQLVRWCRRELRSLGAESPLDLETLRQRLQQRRGKPLSIRSAALQVGSYGLWVSFTDRDLILYQEETTPDHQRHIILHELGHVLAGHHSDEADVDALSYLMPHLSSSLVHAVLRRTCYDAEHERAAEVAATIMSEWAERTELVTPSRSQGSSRWVDGALNAPVGWS